ncbi:MAG: bifunctional riboflavin kinase/FAD synthetase [Prolixibacteraceae bacterium]
MIVHHNLDHFKAKNPVITIGTFDGVHLGHRKVIDQLNEIAKRVGGESVLFTFYPHPRLVVSKDESNLRLLTTLEEKTLQMERAGIDHMLVYPFDESFAALSYQEFIGTILIQKMGMHTLVVGHDHRLGRNREGTYDKIVALSKQLNFKVQKIDALLIDEVDISSSKIRKALQDGEIVKVNNYLGYRFSIRGKVAVGNQIGRKIGFPTANVEASDPYKLIPAEGVYAIITEFDGKFYPSMLNIGYRPTIDTNADRRTVETHLFNFNEDIYQKEVTLHFYQRVRNEKKFSSLDELKAQLKKDEVKVREILRTADLSQ